MVIFHSYVSLPEGNTYRRFERINPLFSHVSGLYKQEIRTKISPIRWVRWFY